MAASFSIREYTASTRGTASSRHPLLGAGDFPPMPARRFRWWADELPAPAAARSPPPRPRAPEKKRSVSDFCASASASAADEASCAIKKRAKTVIKQQKKRGSQEDEDRIKAQLGRRSGEEDDDVEIFGSTPKAKVVALNKFNPLDSARTSMVTKREHIKIQNGKIHEVESRKLKKFKNLKKHKLKYIGGTKAINAQILGNSAKVLPLHNILKKYTKHLSVSMKEKCSNSKGPEVMELCHKFVKHVTFSGVDDILSSNKQSSKLPQRLSLCKVFADVLAASSSSTDNSDQADIFIAADSSAHKNKETSFEASQSVRNISDGGSSVSSRIKLPPGLIDLNRAPPDSADFNYPSISDSELPNLEHAKNATCDSDFQILGDGRETVLKHNQNLPFNSQPVQCELNIYDSGRIINSKSVVTLLPREASNISHTEMVSLPLNSRGEFTKFYADYQRSSVRDSKMKGKAPYAFPHHTVEYSIQHPQNWYTNLNQGNFHPTGGEFCCYQSLNPPHSRPRFHSNMNVQPGHAAVVGHTVRLMGKDLTVSSSRSKCIGETAKEHADPSKRCHHTTKMFLELPREGRPFLSLQSQSFSNISADAPSTSQAYVGYRLHHVRHRFPEAGVFSGNGKECGDRFRNFSYLHHGRNAPSRFPPHPDHDSTRSNQNLLAPCYSDLFSTPEPQMTTFFPTFVSHMTRSSVYHANSTRPYYPYSAIVHPHDGMNCTYALKQSDQITREVAEVKSDVAILSRNTGRKTTRTHVGNSSISSGARYMRRSGPVKLSAGAKHVLELSRNTDDDNPPPVYSCLPLVIISRGGNISSGQNKVAESCK